MRLLRRAIRAYEATQIELQSQYSLERLRALEVYCSTTSNLRVVAVLATMLLPCLAAITLLELIPMPRIDAGLSHSALFFVRSAIVAFVITATILDQCRRFVPSFHMTVPTVVAMALVTTCATAGCEVGLAYLIAYPLPFTIIMSVPARFGTIGVLLGVCYSNVLRRSHQARQELYVCAMGLTAQVSLIVIYPLFNFAFQRAQSSSAQTALTLLLPTIKVFAKNWIAHAYRDMEDVRLEMVVFNSEIFHALYVAVCMQTSRTMYTIVLIMAMDLTQLIASMLDVRGLLRGIAALQSILRSELPDHMMASAVEPRLVMEPALFIVDHDAEIQLHPAMLEAVRKIEVVAQHNGTVKLKSNVTSKSVRGKSQARVFSEPKQLPLTLSAMVATDPSFAPSYAASTSLKVAAGKDTMTTISTPATAEKVKYVQQILVLLHVTEFLLLIQFMEVLIPVIYCA